MCVCNFFFYCGPDLYAFVFLINPFPLINKMENSQNSFSVPKWIMKMGCFRFWIYTWMGMGFFPLPRTKKKLQNLPNPDCQLYLRTFPLKFPLMLTLELPSVNKGQFPLKIPRPSGQSRSKMAEMQFFFIKTALLVNFP